VKYLRLEIPGRPAPKGSRTFGRRKDGSIYNRESSSRSSDWMKGAAEIIRQQARGRTLEPPYRVAVTFTFLPPKKGSAWPVQGDLDKYCRNALDAAGGALKTGPLVDDRHVIELVASKEYGSVEQTTLHIWSLADD
jgi:Holliday junction resolvase RusA-like endonuclease